MNIRKITSDDYETLLELDQKVYPTPEPVTKENLDSWYVNHREFGIIFEQENKIVGMCIAIPLTRKGWLGVISGEYSESDLVGDLIFNNSQHSELAIHIYHIEKFSNIEHFYEKALDQLSIIFQNLKKVNPSLRMIGFSALCVTSQGIGLFANKLNLRERNFINTEHILEKNGEIEIINAESNNDIQQKVLDGYTYKNRCKMLVTYPGEISLVWNYF